MTNLQQATMFGVDSRTYEEKQDAEVMNRLKSLMDDLDNCNWEIEDLLDDLDVKENERDDLERQISEMEEGESEE